MQRSLRPHLVHRGNIEGSLSLIRPHPTLRWLQAPRPRSLSNPKMQSPRSKSPALLTRPRDPGERGPPEPRSPALPGPSCPALQLRVLHQPTPASWRRRRRLPWCCFSAACVGGCPRAQAQGRGGVEAPSARSAALGGGGRHRRGRYLCGEEVAGKPVPRSPAASSGCVGPPAPGQPSISLSPGFSWFTSPLPLVWGPRVNLSPALCRVNLQCEDDKDEMSAGEFARRKARRAGDAVEGAKDSAHRGWFGFKVGGHERRPSPARGASTRVLHAACQAHPLLLSALAEKLGRFALRCFYDAWRLMCALRCSLCPRSGARLTSPTRWAAAHRAPRRPLTARCAPSGLV
jgi:hypothetical protein